jgi:NhaP-type Na+/H+ or K+/H+ antiporter
MMRAVIGFNEQLERLAEVTVVSLVGVMLSRVAVDYRAMIIVIALLVIIRPLAVNLSLFGKKTARKKMHIYPAQRLLISWFGIRGIGSVYYLFYAINRDLPRDMIGFFIATTLLVVATSIVFHGISVTPLMNYYEKNTKNKR